MLPTKDYMGGYDTARIASTSPGINQPALQPYSAVKPPQLVTPGTSTAGSSGGNNPPNYLQTSSAVPPTPGPLPPASSGYTGPQPPSSGVPAGSPPPQATPAPQAQGAAAPQAQGANAPQYMGAPAASASAPDSTLANLGNVLSQHIANPSRFDLPEVQKAFDFFKQDLGDQAKLAESNATADAARRGVFYGTPLTTSLGDIHTQFQRGLGALATNLGLEQAQTQGQDITSALGQGMQFGGQAMQGQNQAFQQALAAAGLGSAGAPTMTGMFGGALGAMSPLLAYGQGSPNMYQNLGYMLSQG